MSKQPIRILHFSSTYRDLDCGIGKYQEQYLAGMADSAQIYNKFFEISPYQTRAMSPAEMDNAMAKLKDELKDYDILHIQHEFGLYWEDQFAKIVETGRVLGKKVVITVHLAPASVKEIAPVKLGGYGPHSWIHYIKELRHHNRMIQYHIVPMRLADAVIVHNDVTANSLMSLGIDQAKIIKLPHPVYDIKAPPLSEEISQKLKKADGDIIFCITGFLHRYKNILDAVKSLKFLPSNYKLALVGGIKGDSDEVSYQNRITDLIDQLGLQERVYITGFVPDDDRLNALIRECQVCVYPYDSAYYSNVSSGALSLAFANHKPVIAYPTESFKEAAKEVEGAIVLCSTFAYYEMARELLRLDIPRQIKLSDEYANKLAWPKMSKKLAAIYEEIYKR